MTAKTIQIGGNHYKDLAIQPVEYIHKNNLGYVEGSVIKYVTRWKNKNGIQDLQKAKHFLELLIDMEQKKLNVECEGKCSECLEGNNH